MFGKNSYERTKFFLNLATFLAAGYVALAVWLGSKVAIPVVPGATASEQEGIVTRGYFAGRRLRDFTKTSFSESRYAMALRFERSGDWEEAQEWWAQADRGRRDEPFQRIAAPEMERDCPLGPGAPTKDQIRRRTLWAKGLALGEGS